MASSRKMNFLHKSLIVAIIICPSLSFSQKDDAILKIGQKITLHSEILNETRDVWVYLPPNYSDKYFQTQHFPVLYVLDGDLHFHSLSGLIQILGSGVNQTFAIPEMIIVAIPNTNRMRDLLPTHSKVGPYGKEYDFYEDSGGTDKFLKFITNEVAPKIESMYSTSPYRIFVGQSFGGLTVIHALFTIPNFFQAYVAIDPSLWWDNQVILKKAENYFNETNLQGKSLYLAQANSLRSWDSTNVHFEGIRNFGTYLETRNRSGIRWKYKYYPDDTHSSVAFISEYDALRFFFEKYSTDYNNVSSPEDLKKRFQQFSQDAGVKFLPPERITQDYGSVYKYLGKDDIAQGFFQMNIDNYPQSSSAYANMGQFWKDKGDKKKAQEYYAKSLRIFPDNEDARNNYESLKKELDGKK
jgi:predicted alpha/beta superfamily hydrolase